MRGDNLVELIDPMLNSAGAAPLALYIHNRTQASDDRLTCLKNPRPEGAESSLTESASSPFQAEPAHFPLLDSVIIPTLCSGERLVVLFYGDDATVCDEKNRMFPHRTRNADCTQAREI